MELRVNELIQYVDGEVWKDEDGKLTLGKILKFAIRRPIQGDNQDGVKTYHLGQLWDQIQSSEKIPDGALDLPVEDVALLKERIAKTVADPVLVKRVWDALEAK